MISEPWIKWSTVIITPSLWWRLRMLLRPKPLVFCWGTDEWFLDGFEGEFVTSIGGVPMNQRHRFKE